jgi:homoserine/homoserine lactone efflux protein
MSEELLLLLIPTIAAVSLTPGMCMTLAFSLGLSIGYRGTLFMMLGELLGVTLVVSATTLLLTWLLALDAVYFQVLAIVGAAYLLWIAWQLWNTKEHFASGTKGVTLGPLALLALGFSTAVMNPKGWAFMIALLPGFISAERDLAPQLVVLLSVVVVSEFLSMSLYASGGRWLGRLLKDDHNLVIVNRLAAIMMLLVAGWVLL